MMIHYSSIHKFRGSTTTWVMVLLTIVILFSSSPTNTYCHAFVIPSSSSSNRILRTVPNSYYYDASSSFVIQNGDAIVSYHHQRRRGIITKKKVPIMSSTTSLSMIRFNSGLDSISTALAAVLPATISSTYDNTTLGIAATVVVILLSGIVSFFASRNNKDDDDTTVRASSPSNPTTSSSTTVPTDATRGVKKSTTALAATIRSTSTTDVTTGSSESNVDIVYDLAIIGAGVVGASAALTAAQEIALQANNNNNNDVSTKKRIILLDAPKASGMLYNDNTDEDLSLGGPTGLFSKALRDTSKRINVGTLRGMGLREDSVWNEIINSCVDLAHSNAQDIVRQLVMSKVTYQRGFVTFVPKSSAGTQQQSDSDSSITKLNLQNEDGSRGIVQAKNVLVCTGSKPFLPKGVPFDGVRIFDSDSINTLRYLPKSIAITGSGIIAVEFAKIFRNLGADVTVIIRDNSPRNALMKIGLDKDVAATLVADLVRCGIKFVRGAQVKSFVVPPLDPLVINKEPIKILLQPAGGKTELPSGSPTELKCDAYLAAVGRVPNTADLNLQDAGIDVDDYGGIIVNGQLRTTAPSGSIYAAGDVLGRPFLASTGVAQSKAAVKNIFNPTSLVKYECEPGDLSCSIDGISQAGESFDPASLASNPFAFPTGVWSSPEASYYGLSVQQAKERGIECGEAMALYAECLRGRVFSPNGLLKLVYEKPAGRILGVHICGDDACELIHYGMELVKSQRTVLELSQAMFSAVTFHEMYRIAAQAALDEAGARQRRAAAGKALAQRNRLIRDNALQ